MVIKFILGMPRCAEDLTSRVECHAENGQPALPMLSGLPPELRCDSGFEPLGGAAVGSAGRGTTRCLARGEGLGM